MKGKNLIVGIDTGVNTGIGVVHKEFGLRRVESRKILDAMDLMLELKDEIIVIIVEDARFVKYKVKRERAQGAGSVKRDAQIWEDFLKKHEINYRMVRPMKAITKIDSDKFTRMTNWNQRTNGHGRDAAMIALSYRKQFT